MLNAWCVTSHRSLFIFLSFGHRSSVTPTLSRVQWPSATGCVATWRTPSRPREGWPPSGSGAAFRHSAGEAPAFSHAISAGHPIEDHFGSTVYSISFIPWFCKGLCRPKGPYPNQTSHVPPMGRGRQTRADRHTADIERPPSSLTSYYSQSDLLCDRSDGRIMPLMVRHLTP